MVFRRLTRRQFNIGCEIETINYIWILLLQISRDLLIEIVLGIVFRDSLHIVITLINHTTNIIGSITPASADIRMIIINVLSIKCSIKSFIFYSPNNSGFSLILPVISKYSGRNSLKSFING